MKCPCKYTYDPEKGDPKQGIPPGTQFEDLPDDWRCPRCKQPKEKFTRHNDISSVVLLKIINVLSIAKK